jgi:tetratricopeptide (TPR) repeat protein
MERIKALWLTISVLLLGIAALLNQPQPERVNGCLWDRDTLAMEADHYPGITEIITGRFDRYPDLYYEMRLERVTQEIEDAPGVLALYDDAGVACDRLGRCDEAIAWMARKRAVLDSLSEPDSEHEYRYLANLGTFHIHRWLSAGADREDMQDAERARELIAAAIELNPDAHFGRERYQLLAIEWILNHDGFEHGMGQTMLHQIPEYEPRTRGTSRKELINLGYDDAVEGISGLITLGAAWLSLDVFNSLAYALSDSGNHVLASLCMMRVREIFDGNGLSLYPNFNYTLLDRVPGMGQVEREYEDIIRFWYEQARAESEQWQASRRIYMLDHLYMGKHPDTHDDFWKAWSETTSPPKFPRHPDSLLSRDNTIFVAICALVCASALWVMRRLKKPSPETA